MCFKLLIALSLLALCSAEPPSHPDHSATHHAVSSQSYNRGDVPLSYKYSAVHVYTTPKPGQYKDHLPQHHYEERNHEQPSYYQYAPVESQKTRPQELYTKVASEPSEPQVSYHGGAPSKALEPQEQPHHQLSYVHGQNVHVLPSVARRPEYSAYYRPHKVPVHEKQNDSSLQNHHQVYHDVFLPSVQKASYYETPAAHVPAPAPEKTVVYTVVQGQHKTHPFLFEQSEATKEAQSNQRAPMVIFNIAKSKPYYPYNLQKTVFPHYHQDVKQLQYRVNEPKHTPLNYIYAQKPHNYYVSDQH